MEYIRHTTDFEVSEDTAVSLGKFDGIHRGHKRLLEYLEEKKKKGLKGVGYKPCGKKNLLHKAVKNVRIIPVYSLQVRSFSCQTTRSENTGKK